MTIYYLGLQIRRNIGTHPSNNKSPRIHVHRIQQLR